MKLRFLLSGAGWPYLLVPFIAVAIGLGLWHAEAGLIFGASALGVIPTAAPKPEAESSKTIATAMKGTSSYGQPPR